MYYVNIIVVHLRCERSRFNKLNIFASDVSDFSVDIIVILSL